MKAAVLPEPVSAQDIKSRPLMAIAIAYFCTGVGLLYLAFYQKENDLLQSYNI